MQQKFSKIVELSLQSLYLKNSKVLQNINFNIYYGDKIGLIGPNGSGKTSLLRVLAGIYKDYLGSLKKNQNFFFLSSPGTVTSPHLKVLDNIKRLFYFYNIKNIDEKKLFKHIDEFDLTQYLTYDLSELSQGFQLRVQMVAYLMMQFNHALIDEFIGFGDNFIMSKFESILNDKLINAGSLVIASHNYKLINKFCNRIIHLNNGQIIKDERIAE